MAKNCPFLPPFGIICFFLFVSHRTCKIQACHDCILGVRVPNPMEQWKKKYYTVIWVVFSNIVLFSSRKLGEMIPIWLIFFQWGWNHQLVMRGLKKKHYKDPGSPLTNQDSMEKYSEPFFCLWLKCQLVFCQLRGLRHCRCWWHPWAVLSDEQMSNLTGPFI